MAVRQTLKGVLERLTAEGLAASTDAEAWRKTLSETGSPSPWFVRLLVGFGAWVAAWMFLGLLIVAKVLDGKEGAIVIGLLLLGSATALRYVSRADFPVQLAFAFCLAGEGSFLAGLSDFADKNVVLIAFGLQLLVGAFYPDRTMRFLSALAAGLLLLGLPYVYELPPWTWDASMLLLVAAVGATWMEQPRWLRTQLAKAHTPVAFGVTVALLGGLLVAVVADEAKHEYFLRHAHYHPYVGPATSVCLAAGVALLLWRVFAEHGVALLSDAPLAALAALGLLSTLTWRTPGILVAVGVLALGFHRSNVVLSGLGLVFLVLFGAGFYYQLELSLLVKSGVLVGSGLLFIALAAFVRWRGRTVAGAAP